MNWCIFHALDPVGGSGGAGLGSTIGLGNTTMPREASWLPAGATGTGIGTGLGLATDLTTGIGLIIGGKGGGTTLRIGAARGLLGTGGGGTHTGVEGLSGAQKNTGGGNGTPGFFTTYFGLKLGSATCSNVLRTHAGFVAGSGTCVNTFRLYIYTFYKDTAFKLV